MEQTRTIDGWSVRRRLVVGAVVALAVGVTGALLWLAVGDGAVPGALDDLPPDVEVTIEV